MKNFSPSNFKVASPELFALLDRSREGNPGIHLRRDGDQPAVDQQTAPTALDEDHFPQEAPNRDVTLRCGHIGQAPAHIKTPNSFRAYRAWAKRNRDCKECFLQGKARTTVSVAMGLGLPRLGGTDKQVAWAMSIRHRYLGQTLMARAENPKFYRDVMAWFKCDCRARDAAFLIEHRALDLEGLMTLVSGPGQ